MLDVSLSLAARKGSADPTLLVISVMRQRGRGGEGQAHNYF